MKRIYIEKTGKPVGPYAPDDVRAMLARGEVQVTTLAVEEGGTDWQPLSKVLNIQPAPMETSARPANRDLSAMPIIETDTFVTRFVDGIVEFLVNLPASPGAPTRELYFSLAARLNSLGSYAALAGGGLAALFGLIAAVRTDQGFLAFIGLAALVIAVLAHYFGAKFAAANLRLLSSDTARISSSVIPDSLTVCYLILAGLVTVGSVLIGLSLMGSQFLLGLLSFGYLFYAVLLLFAAWCTSHPEEILFTKVDTTGRISAGEYVISIVKFFYRQALALTPVLYGAGGAFACLLTTIMEIAVLSRGRSDSGFSSMFNRYGNQFAVNPFESPAMEGVMSFTPVLALIPAFLPICIHFLYVFGVFAVDLAGAIFRIDFNTSKTE